MEIAYPDVYTSWADGTYAVTFGFDQAENKIYHLDQWPMGAASTEYDFDTLLSTRLPNRKLEYDGYQCCRSLDHRQSSISTM